MKKYLLNFGFFLALTTFFSPATKAQLILQSYDVPTMVQDFFGNNCVTISDISYLGGDSSVAFFDGSQTNLGINAGILITSGSASNAQGPNNSGGTSTSNNLLGDEDLEALCGYTYPTYDASVIELTIVPNVDTLFFNYIFGSEEYQEYVGSSFNDAFAFLIKGPGYDQVTNIALIPGDTLPVAINYLNQTNNNQYYSDNGDGASEPFQSDPAYVQYDGLTVPLTCFAPVTPGETYKVKIVVADAGDSVLDSGVFIGIESLCGDGNLAPIVTDFDWVEVGKTNSNTINFSPKSRYGTKYQWDFGDGNNSHEKTPAHLYQNEGTYTVQLTVSNYCCSTTFSKTIQVNSVGGITPYILNTAALVLNNNNLQINIPNTENAQLTIFDVTGKTILQQNILSKNNINIAHLQNGMYVAYITTLSGKYYTQQLIKK